MAIGERINYFRKRCNLTMSALGQLLGFDIKGADVRIAQYENNSKGKRIKIELSNGKSYTETLTVKSVDNRKDIQHISFNTATTSYVKITILSIQKGEEYDDTCITYISPTAP